MLHINHSNTTFVENTLHECRRQADGQKTERIATAYTVRCNKTSTKH